MGIILVERSIQVKTIALNKDILNILLQEVSLQSNHESDERTDSAGFTYRCWQNDPFGLRLYVLDNGLRLYLSSDKNYKLLDARIAVRAGSALETPGQEGSAHLLEHMMFKGTSTIGALDYEKEKSLLHSLENHRCGHDALRRQLNSLSTAGEWDALAWVYGIQDMNAHTGYDETVYSCRVPVFRLNEWLLMERDRFSHLVFRNFDLEKNTVMEEWNQLQDDDLSRSYTKLNSLVYGDHPYGRSDILGTSSSLEKLSVQNIRQFYNTFYTPENMALCLHGDLDFSTIVSQINNIWGSVSRGTGSASDIAGTKVMKQNKSATLRGLENECLLLGYVFPQIEEDQEISLSLLDMLLSNQQAGLLDLKLVQPQLLYQASTSLAIHRQGGLLSFHLQPHGKQNAEECRIILTDCLTQWRREGISSEYLNACFEFIKQDWYESVETDLRSDLYADSFISGRDWKFFLDYPERTSLITREELNRNLDQLIDGPCAEVIKRQSSSEDDDLIILPERSAQMRPSRDFSSFFKSEKGRPYPLDSLDESSLSFTGPLKHLNESFKYFADEKRPVFTWYFYFPKGRGHDPALAAALAYLGFGGTKKYSAEKLQELFFLKTLDWDIQVELDYILLQIKGLSGAVDKAWEHLHHFMTELEGDEDSFASYLDYLQSVREERRHSRDYLLKAVLSYVRFGKRHPETCYESVDTLMEKGAVRSCRRIAEWFHRGPGISLFHGTSEDAARANAISRGFFEQSELQIIPDPLPFQINESHSAPMLLIHESQQTDCLLYCPGPVLSLKSLAFLEIYNALYGNDTHSLVFRELRELSGLSYQNHAALHWPEQKEWPLFFTAHVNTGQDSVAEALNLLKTILIDKSPDADDFYLARQFAAIQISHNYADGQLRLLKSLTVGAYNLPENLKYQLYCLIKEFSYESFESIRTRWLTHENIRVFLAGSSGTVLQGAGPLTHISVSQLLD